MNERLYKSLLEDKIIVIVDEAAITSNYNYKSFYNYINNLENKDIFNFNMPDRAVSIPSKRGKIYFNTVSSLEKIRSIEADDFIYNGNDDRVISFLKTRIVTKRNVL